MENNSPFVMRKNREESLVLDLQDSISTIQLNREDLIEFLRSEMFYLSSTYPAIFKTTVLEANNDILLNVGGRKEKSISLTLFARELDNIRLKIKVGDTFKNYFLEERKNNLPGYHLTNNGEDTFDLQNTIVNSEFKFTLINLFTTKVNDWSTENSDSSII